MNKKMTRTPLPWKEKRGELHANGGGARTYLIEEKKETRYGLHAAKVITTFMLKGRIKDLRFSGGPYPNQDDAVRAAEELEHMFEDRVRRAYRKVNS